MTFKQVAIYFATVVLTSSVSVAALLLFMTMIVPSDRYVGYSWAFVSFTVITVIATITGIMNQYEYESRKK